MFALARANPEMCGSSAKAIEGMVSGATGTNSSIGYTDPLGVVFQEIARNTSRADVKRILEKAQALELPSEESEAVEH